MSSFGVSQHNPTQEASNAQFIQQNQLLQQEIEDILQAHGDHMEVYCSSQGDIPINWDSVAKMESILFLSDCLMNFQVIKFDANCKKLGKLSTWKLFEINIHEDGNISVSVQSVGLENLRLIPEKKQNDFGTLIIFYLFRAACINKDKIQNKKIQEHFKQHYNFQNYWYHIFGSKEYFENIVTNFEQFQQLCYHFLSLNIKEEEICDFFDLIFECVHLGGEREKCAYDDFGPQKVEEGSANWSTGLDDDFKSQFDKSIVCAQDLYFSACNWFLDRVASLGYNSDVVEQIIAIEKGVGNEEEKESKIENKKISHKNLVDLMDTYCNHTFATKSKIKESFFLGLTTFFNSINQIKPGGVIKSLQVSGLKKHLNKMGMQFPNNDKLLDAIDFQLTHYDLKDLQTLQPLMREKVKEVFLTSEYSILKQQKYKEPINILTYISNQISKISLQWFSRGFYEGTQLSEENSNIEAFIQSVKRNQQESQQISSDANSQSVQYRNESQKVELRARESISQNSEPQSLQNIPQANKQFFKRSA